MWDRETPTLTHASFVFSYFILIRSCKHTYIFTIIFITLASNEEAEPSDDTEWGKPSSHKRFPRVSSRDSGNGSTLLSRPGSGGQTSRRGHADRYIERLPVDGATKVRTDRQLADCHSELCPRDIS